MNDMLSAYFIFLAFGVVAILIGYWLPRPAKHNAHILICEDREGALIHSYVSVIAISDRGAQTMYVFDDADVAHRNMKATLAAERLANILGLRVVDERKRS